MPHRLDPIDRRLLDNWQRAFPLVPRPFLEIARAEGLSEAVVLGRLAALQGAGSVARVGATVRPNTVAASTLAALRVPDWRIEEVAEIVGREEGVNHSYLREHDWNLWFVVTGPTREDLDATLARIEAQTGLKPLDLPLVRPFNLDLGFTLGGPRDAMGLCEAPDTSVIRDGDAPLIQALTRGLPLVPRPFAAVARALGREEAEVIERLAVLVEARIIARLGVIVRHRALGWRANAMVVWRLPEARIPAAGAALARHPGVTLAYQRRTVPGIWPYGLFCMIHAQTRAEALDLLTEAAALPELQGAEHRALFSVRCFKQTGALVHRRGATGVAAE